MHAGTQKYMSLHQNLQIYAFCPAKSCSHVNCFVFKLYDILSIMEIKLFYEIIKHTEVSFQQNEEIIMDEHYDIMKSSVHVSRQRSSVAI